MSEKVYQLKVTLRDIAPPIWRRLRVPGAIDLLTLHDVIQIAFDWDDSHLHQFIVRRVTYSTDDDGGYSGAEQREDETFLEDIARARSKLLYEYDFGDCWRHDIVVERVEAASPGEPLVVCVAGARSGPQEDSGGPWGYADKLASLANKRSEDHADIRDWFGPDFDPEAFDIGDINARFAMAFAPAKPPPRKAAAAKKKPRKKTPVPYSPRLN